jgi:hypothetical protein
VLLILCGVPGKGRSQEEGGLVPPLREIPAAVSFLAPIVFPVKIIQDEARLREFVTGPVLAAARRTMGDRGAVDVLFRRAMELSWNNKGEALAICLLATLEHRNLGIRLPLVGAVLWIPLTGEFEDEFAVRVACLPSRLYADTPPEGDRDKLQHFFGSAFLTLVSESADEADAAGVFIEDEEEALVVGGSRDERDIRANREGQRFALALMGDQEALPSPFFTDGSSPAGDKESP